MKKVVITGANGFVGSWLCKELEKYNIEIIAIVRNENSNISNIKYIKNIRIINCELSNIKDLKNKVIDRDIDVFYHLAWEGSGGKSRGDYNLQLLNIKYTCDCANLAKEIRCNKFVCSGTITENIASNALNLDVKSENIIYGLTKHTARCMLDVICKNIKLDYIWMQFSNVYGPFNTSGNIVNYTLSEFIKGNRPSFTSGEQIYDLVYVKDLVKAIYMLGDNKTNKNFYFLGSGTPRHLKDYLIDIKDVFASGCEIGLGERPEDNLKYEKNWFSIDSLLEDVGYQSTYSFKEGITETIKFEKSRV